MRLVSAICRLGAAIAELFLLRSKRKPSAEAEQAATDAREAVAHHDEDAVNAAIEDARLRRAARRRSGFCVLEILVAILILALCLAFGCVRVRTRTLVIPADRHTVHIVHEGVEGWFVPDATMADLVESYVLDSQTPKGE